MCSMLSFNPISWQKAVKTFSEFIGKFLHLLIFRAYLYFINSGAVPAPADLMQKFSEIKQMQKFTNNLTELFCALRDN